MVKGKFQEYLPHQRNSWTYSCLYCRANLARHEDLISKSFQGSQGRAYLFHRVTNVEYSEAKQRVLLTGIHFVADVFCACCQTMLGWKYERAFEPSQRYKEGKVIIELAHLIKDNGWDTEWFDPPRRRTYSFSSTSSASFTPIDSSPLFESPETTGLESYFSTLLDAPSHHPSVPTENSFVCPTFPTNNVNSEEMFFNLGALNAYPSSSTQSTPWPDNQVGDAVSSVYQESAGHRLQASNTLELANSLCSLGLANNANDEAMLVSDFTCSSIETPAVLESVGVNETSNSKLFGALTLANPQLSSSQEFFQGQTRRYRKRTFFSRRISSNSPTRSSLLPLVSETDDEDGQGWLNQFDTSLTPPPRLL